MILSFSRRFLFIKTRKTAGTSMEVHLAAHCGPDDIVTRIGPPNPDHVPRNHSPGGEAIYYNHMPATRVRELQPDAFASAFKFCFERHPVDKCLSMYAMIRNAPDHRSPMRHFTWEQYVENGDFPVDTERYCDADGRVIFDRIYRYEELERSLREISARIGLEYRPLTVREKSRFRFDVPSVADVLRDAGQRDRIMSAFASTLTIVPYDA